MTASCNERQRMALRVAKAHCHVKGSMSLQQRLADSRQMHRWQQIELSKCCLASLRTQPCLERRRHAPGGAKALSAAADGRHARHEAPQQPQRSRDHGIATAVGGSLVVRGTRRQQPCHTAAASREEDNYINWSLRRRVCRLAWQEPNAMQGAHRPCFIESID